MKLIFYSLLFLSSIERANQLIRLNKSAIFVNSEPNTDEFFLNFFVAFVSISFSQSKILLFRQIFTLETAGAGEHSQNSESGKRQRCKNRRKKILLFLFVFSRVMFFVFICRMFFVFGFVRMMFRRGISSNRENSGNSLPEMFFVVLPKTDCADNQRGGKSPK